MERRDSVLAEELTVLDADSPLWNAVHPLLHTALRLEHNDESYIWHGWQKQYIDTFLKSLPAKCSLLVGVWETIPATEDEAEYEQLVLGAVCEVIEGEVCAIRTFEDLERLGLKPVAQLEPGIEDALELMRVVKLHIAPVAWALFTDKVTWDEWVFAMGEDGGAQDKGELLAVLARFLAPTLNGSFIDLKGSDDGLKRTAPRQKRDDPDNGFHRILFGMKERSFGGSKRLLAGSASPALAQTIMDTQVALVLLSS